MTTSSLSTTGSSRYVLCSLSFSSPPPPPMPLSLARARALSLSLSFSFSLSRFLHFSVFSLSFSSPLFFSFLSRARSLSISVWLFRAVGALWARSARPAVRDDPPPHIYTHTLSLSPPICGLLSMAGRRRQLLLPGERPTLCSPKQVETDRRALLRPQALPPHQSSDRRCTCGVQPRVRRSMSFPFWVLFFLSSSLFPLFFLSFF